MCAVCGLKVKSLKRISIGSLKLGDLESGQWRFLTKEEVTALGNGHIASY
jgi:16S rRNA U516 pseudouridylate synthase RsuA-like enzyme